MESILFTNKQQDLIETFLEDLRATDPEIIRSLKDNALVVIVLELHAIRRILSLKFPVT